MPPRRTALPVSPPVLLVHGMWLSAASWQNWIDRFAAEGYEASAPVWPGERPTAAETRANAADLAGVSMERLVTHYAELIGRLPVQPILIGSSLGGTVVQKLLAAGYGAGGVVLDSARFDGELPGALAALRLALPQLTDASAADRALALTDYQFRFAFGRTLGAEESDSLFREFAIPAPARLLLEPATAGIDLPPLPGRTPKAPAPLLVLESAAAGASTDPSDGSLAGGRRHIYAEALTDPQPTRFPDRGASFAFDAGWEAVAETALAWIRDRFGAARPAAASGRGRTALRGTAA